ncbi:MAG: hypothetical protein IKH65_02570 [Clostridia bacterium]|nr:hypothetical protein [Clostridia bacterium]
MNNSNPYIKIIAVILIAAAVLFIFGNKGGKDDVSVAGLPDPIQTAATGGTEFEAGDYSIKVTYKYAYELDALAISTKDYFGSAMNDLIAPVDVAFAWGKVAEYNDRIDFHWRQSGRWYYWSVDGGEDLSPVGGVDGINQHSANCHLIPADDTVRKTVKSIKTGDHVKLSGYLIDLKGEKADGSYRTWNSSVSRNDTGDGACEVIYVTKISIVK